MNQRHIIGPKKRAMRRVPNRWSMNNTNKITTAIGTTSFFNDGLFVLRPSTADKTEIAGVIIPSPAINNIG
jgi:hypothetical protein